MSAFPEQAQAACDWINSISSHTGVTAERQHSWWLLVFDPFGLTPRTPPGCSGSSVLSDTFDDEGIVQVATFLGWGEG